MANVKIDMPQPTEFKVGNLYERKEAGDIFIYCQTGMNEFNMIDFTGCRYAFIGSDTKLFHSQFGKTFIPFSGKLTLWN